MKTDGEQLLKECHDFWFALIQKALDKESFSALCTLLRPGSMHDAGWDVLDESQATFDDFNWILEKTRKERGVLSARRFALHYYCFLIEMTPIHEIIVNILRCISNQMYLPFPFAHLYRKKSKKKPWSVIPPSMPKKIGEIANLAQQLGEDKLIEHLKFFFHEDLRNAIAHSDYVLTDKEFRTRGSGPANVLRLHIFAKVSWWQSYICFTSIAETLSFMDREKICGEVEAPAGCGNCMLGTRRKPAAHGQAQ